MNERYRGSKEFMDFQDRTQGGITGWTIRANRAKRNQEDIRARVEAAGLTETVETLASLTVEGGFTTWASARESAGLSAGG